MDASKNEGQEVDGEEVVEQPAGVSAQSVADDEIAKVRMNIWLRRDLYEKVQSYAKDEDISLTDVIRKAIKDLMQKEGRA